MATENNTVVIITNNKVLYTHLIIACFRGLIVIEAYNKICRLF